MIPPSSFGGHHHTSLPPWKDGVNLTLTIMVARVKGRLDETCFDTIPIWLCRECSLKD